MTTATPAEHTTNSLTTLPTITTVPSLPTETRAQILDLLFEACTQLHTLSVPLLHDRTFDSYSSLIAAVGQQFTALLESDLQSDREWLYKILAAHPRLGEKKVATLSEASRKEQEAMKKAEAGSGQGAGEAELVAEKLRGLNDEYEKAFGGMKYVVFVNGRSRPVIMEDMERRIKRGDLLQEKKDAIQAMCDIAIDRAKKMGGA